MSDFKQHSAKRIILYTGVHESTRFSCRILMKLEYLHRCSKNTHIPNFIKIRPVEGDLFHAEGETHKTKLKVAFRDFTNAPKNWGTTMSLRSVYV